MAKNILKPKSKNPAQFFNGEFSCVTATKTQVKTLKIVGALAFRMRDTFEKTRFEIWLFEWIFGHKTDILKNFQP